HAASPDIALGILISDLLARRHKRTNFCPRVPRGALDDRRDSVMSSGPERGHLKEIDARGAAHEGDGARSHHPELPAPDSSAQSSDHYVPTRIDRRFKDIVEAAPQGVWTLDSEGFVSFANANLERFLGYACGALRERHGLDLVAREGRQQAAELFSRAQ